MDKRIPRPTEGGHVQLNTYLVFDGDCADAFAFYERHLGATITAMLAFREAPPDERIPPELHDKIMHAELAFDGHLLMGSDGGCISGQRDKSIRGAHVVLGVDTPAEAERVYAVLSEDGAVEMGMHETFFAHRFGMAVDRFGVPWMVICGRPQQET